MTITPIIFLEDMTDYEVIWAAGLPLIAEQQDAEFYKHSSSSFVCEVKKSGFSVDIYCEGDMSYRRVSDDAQLDDGLDLIFAGYGTSIDFSRALNNDELEHRMNPWFDLYVRGEHLDAAAGEINEALFFAKSFLEEEIANLRQIENFGVSGLDLPA